MGVAVPSWFEPFGSTTGATVADSLTLWTSVRAFALVVPWREVELGRKDTLEGVRHLSLSTSAWRGLLDHLDVLAIAIGQALFAIPCPALPSSLGAADDLCGIVVSLKVAQVGRSVGGRTHATRRAFYCIDDSRGARRWIR